MRRNKRWRRREEKQGRGWIAEKRGGGGQKKERRKDDEKGEETKEKEVEKKEEKNRGGFNYDDGYDEEVDSSTAAFPRVRVRVLKSAQLFKKQTCFVLFLFFFSFLFAGECGKARNRQQTLSQQVYVACT